MARFGYVMAVGLALGVWTLAGVAQVPFPLSNSTDLHWNQGLSVSNSDGAAEFKFGGLLSGEERYQGRTGPGITNAFILRHARPIFLARLGKRYDIRFVPELSGGAFDVMDLLLTVHLKPSLSLSIGKRHVLVAMQFPANGQLFPERSLVSNLFVIRYIGAELEGSARQGNVRYVFGVFNGANDGTQASLGHARPEVAGRILFQPWQHFKGDWRQGLGVSLGGSWGQASGPMPKYKSYAQDQFFSYVPGLKAAGVRERWTPGFFWDDGPLGAYGAFAVSRMGTSIGGSSTTLTQEAWQITAYCSLTGEKVRPQGLTPHDSFNPIAGHWGGFELVFRTGRLAVDPLAFSSGLAAPGSSRTAEDIGGGLDWYLSDSTKLMAGYERTAFNGAQRPPEHGLMLGMQVSFSPSL